MMHPDSSPPDGAADVTVDAPPDGPVDAPSEAADGPTDAPPDAAPTCSDHIQNGNETDVDCGGGTCPPCADHAKCKVPGDCQSSSCSGPSMMLTCQPPSCFDHIKNGTETDVDCGGGGCPKCLVGKSCHGTGDCTTNICNNGACVCPDGMATVSIAQALGAYCVDATEVMKGDYNAFVTANPALNLPAACSFNTTYVPSNDWPPTLTPNGFNGGEPVHHETWCDAYAYCAWKGKHLCGAIAGGPNLQSSYVDPMQDAWFNACSAQGVNAWPYGQSYDPAKCDGADLAPDGGTGHWWADRDINGQIQNAACQGGATGLYQMSGNVAEWEDSCSGNAGASDNCLIRGGSFRSSATDMKCNAMAAVRRDTARDDIGFRCCL